MRKINNEKIITYSLIILSFLLIIFSLFAPYIFTQFSISKINFGKSNEIGETIGGIMGPFIGLTGVLVTFLAFYIQYKTNEDQKEKFEKEKKRQIEEKKRIFFEQQFFEMLNIHNSNVIEINIGIIQKKSLSKNSKKIDKIISGRSVFSYILEEILVTTTLIHKLNNEKKIEFDDLSIFILAYKLCFFGLNIHSCYLDENEINFLNKTGWYKLDLKLRFKEEYNIDNNSSIFQDDDIKFPILNGNEKLLSIYYRHLFQTVKFVVNQDKNILDYAEKRGFLELVRSRLSVEEQTLLFYNWISKLGQAWENNDNKFFTKYRMIHNLPKNSIYSPINIDLLFMDEFEKTYLNHNDTMFDI